MEWTHLSEIWAPAAMVSHTFGLQRLLRHLGQLAVWVRFLRSGLCWPNSIATVLKLQWDASPA